LDLLDRGLSKDKRLILVCAPAGYGKTTLVCEWLQNISNVCWISLEKTDNDPRLFFSYLVASLQKVFPGLGRQAKSFLEMPQSPPLDVVLSALLNDLTDINAQCTIALDDYQAIQVDVIHKGITFLLDHLPSNIHIVITTRSDPALPLHRYRSRGQLLEMRMICVFLPRMSQTT
jgi:LuxR family transcriptional regulator, maltose regulon positive regulatory protein